jgi:hypothetical protein
MRQLRARAGIDQLTQQMLVVAEAAGTEMHRRARVF